MIIPSGIQNVWYGTAMADMKEFLSVKQDGCKRGKYCINL